MLELDACTRCMACVEVCPTITSNDPDGAMERIDNWKKLTPSPLLMKLFQRSEPDYSGILTDISATLTRCTSCGRCAVVCESGIQTSQLWESMRGVCRDRGYRDEALEKKAETVFEKGNPYGEEQKSRSSWIPSSTTIADTAPIAFFAGCTIAFRNPDLGRAALRFLAASKTEFCILDNEEFCCGSILFRTGAWREYADPILSMIHRIQEKGVREVLVPCAGCLKTLTLDWPRVYGSPLPFRVTPFPQFIRDIIREGKVSFHPDITARVIYHDPCHGGRHLLHILGEDSVFDAPREVLSAIPGITALEFADNRQNQSCCGAGGGLKTADPAFSVEIATRKLDTIKEQKVDILVSSCPFCERNFSDALNTGEHTCTVMDMIELVDQALVRQENQSSF